MFKKFIKENFFPVLVIVFLPFIFFNKLLLNPNHVLSPASDVLNAYSIWKNFFVHHVFLYREIPLWNPLEFSGTPFIANPSSGMIYPLTLIFFLIPVDLAFGYAFILNFILLGLFTYIFARSINIGKVGALAASISITFSGTVFSRIYPGHLFILDTFIWFPLILYLFEKGLQRRSILYGFYCAIPISLMLLAGNAQIALYVIFVSFLYMLIRPLLEENKRYFYKQAIRIFVPAIIFGILLSAIQILPIIEFSQISSRSGGVDYSFASSFSLPPKKIISFIFPFFFGSPMDNSYWGLGNFWEFCGYLGIAPLLFALVSFFIKSNKYVKLFFFICIFSILFSLGKYGPFFNFFYNFVPFFDLFRAPSRFLFFYAFAFSILSGFGINTLAKNKIKPDKIKKFAYIIILVSFIATLITSLTYLKILNFQSIFESLILKNRLDLMTKKDILYEHMIFSFITFSIFLFLSSVVLVLFINRPKNKILGHLALIVMVVELFVLNSQFVSTQKPEKYYKTPPEINFIKKDKSTFRVFDFNTGLYSLGQRSSLESITGYNPTYVGYYRDFIWGIGQHEGNKSDSFIQLKSISNYNGLRYLNVKYILSKKEIKNQNLKLMFKNKYYIYELQDTLPRAYLVDETDINVQKLPSKITPIVKSRINANKFSLNFESKNKQKLILSEIWYPGWIAYDNGKEIKINKFLIFRSLNVLPGKHAIEMEYRPMSFELGKWVTFVSLIILLVSVFIIGRKLGFKNTDK